MVLITSTYREYLGELLGCFERETAGRPEEWIISDRLSEKITPDGQMKPFCGATSVIKLSDADRTKCERIQKQLWKNHADLFVKLNPETYHLTIHSFSNVFTVSKDTNRIRAELAGLEGRIAGELLKIGERYGGVSIRMTALGIGCDGRDAVSIKFLPAAENDFRVISDLYNRFETLYPLGEPFIPHVSLAYFKLKKFGRKEIDRLYDTLEQLNAATDFEIRLEIRDFVYQHHDHMNHYRDVYGIQPQQGYRRQ